MKASMFYIQLAILQALQIPSGGPQIAHFFGTAAWIGYLAAVPLSFAYPVGCVVAWFGAVDRWGWNPLIAGVAFFALFIATVLHALIKQRFGRIRGFTAR